MWVFVGEYSMWVFVREYRYLCGLLESKFVVLTLDYWLLYIGRQKLEELQALRSKIYLMDITFASLNHISIVIFISLYFILFLFPCTYKSVFSLFWLFIPLFQHAHPCLIEMIEKKMCISKEKILYTGAEQI